MMQHRRMRNPDFRGHLLQSNARRPYLHEAPLGGVQNELAGGLGVEAPSRLLLAHALDSSRHRTFIYKFVGSY